MKNLWSKKTEIEFFRESLKRVKSEDLFYKIRDRYYAYYPKGYKEKKQTIQSRNALIGEFTENFCKNLLRDFANQHGLYAVNKVICEKLELTKNSPADLALCKTPQQYQKPENIKIIFEIKMSIVNNYEYNPETEEIKFVGDYTTHIGNPSLLRSDSMLKAIGKSLNIRISSDYASKIPIIVLGNTPITNSYLKKVDKLKENGFIQGFWSLYPEASTNLENSEKEGFLTIKSAEDLYLKLDTILKMDLYFVSFMLDKENLGKLIEIVSKEDNLEDKANKFLKLVRGI